MASSSQYPSNLKLLLIGNSSVGQSSCDSHEPSHTLVPKHISLLSLTFLSRYTIGYPANPAWLGKSSLLLRFTDDDFLSEEETAATIGVDFKVKSLELDGRRYKLSIWVECHSLTRKGCW